MVHIVLLRATSSRLLCSRPAQGGANTVSVVQHVRKYEDSLACILLEDGVWISLPQDISRSCTMVTLFSLPCTVGTQIVHRTNAHLVRLCTS